jgi:hypothetical protein
MSVPVPYTLTHTLTYTPSVVLVHISSTKCLNEPNQLTSSHTVIPSKCPQLSPTHTHWTNLNWIQSIQLELSRIKSAALATWWKRPCGHGSDWLHNWGPRWRPRPKKYAPLEGQDTTTAATKRRLLSRLLTPSSGHHHPTSVCSRWLPFFCVIPLSVQSSGPSCTFGHFFIVLSPRRRPAPSVGGGRN